MPRLLDERKGSVRRALAQTHMRSGGEERAELGGEGSQSF
jgi:hypothetical protein